MSKFDEFFDSKMDDPEIREAYEAAVIRQAREIERPCPCGREGCVEFYDPVEDEVTGGWGPAGCPL